MGRTCVQRKVKLLRLREAGLDHNIAGAAHPPSVTHHLRDAPSPASADAAAPVAAPAPAPLPAAQPLPAQNVLVADVSPAMRAKLKAELLAEILAELVKHGPQAP